MKSRACAVVLLLTLAGCMMSQSTSNSRQASFSQSTTVLKISPKQFYDEQVAALEKALSGVAVSDQLRILSLQSYRKEIPEYFAQADIKLVEELMERKVKKLREILLEQFCEKEGAALLKTLEGLSLPDKLSALNVYKSVVPDGFTKAEGEIVCSIMNHKVNEQRKILVGQLRTLQDQLVCSVDEALRKDDFGKARSLINRDFIVFGDDEFDSRFIALRIGLLNLYINPRELVFEKEKLKRLAHAPESATPEDLEKIIAAVEKYNPVSYDAYAGVCEALAAIPEATRNLMLEDAEVKRLVEEYGTHVQALLDGRLSSLTEREIRDFALFDEAMEKVRKAIKDHYRDFPEPEWWNATLSNQTALTTADMNKKKLDYKNELIVNLWARLYAMREAEVRRYANLPEESARQHAATARNRANALYAKVVAQMRNEVDVDSQIAKAELWFSKMSLKKHLDQHEIVVNGEILLEYANVLRRFRNGEKLTDKDATAMLLGGTKVGEEKVVRWAMRLGANVDGCLESDPQRVTALMIACANANFQLVEVLSVDYKASFAACDANKRTPLFYAIEGGDMPIARLAMLKSDLNHMDCNGNPPIFASVQTGRIPFVEKFLQAGAVLVSQNSRIKNVDGDDIVDYAARLGYVDLVEWLREKGYEGTRRTFVIAIEKGHMDLVRYFVERGIPFNEKEIVRAIWSSSGEVKEYFIQKGLKIGMTSTH